MKADNDPFFTPLWTAQALIDRHFSDLNIGDVVLDPSCGPGQLLLALPNHVTGIGVEIDPELAAQARNATGCEIIQGDFRTAPIPARPSAIIGNPPFDAKIIDAFLRRSHGLLPDGGRAGFILPAYYFITARRICEHQENWSLSVELLPRNAFHSRMQTPLVFACFTKDRRRIIVGVALYAETETLLRMSPTYRRLLSQQQGSAWKAVCHLALTRLGGEADLPEIYRELQSHRPTANIWWRDKIRQTLRAGLPRVPSCP